MEIEREEMLGNGEVELTCNFTKEEIELLVGHGFRYILNRYMDDSLNDRNNKVMANDSLNEMVTYHRTIYDKDLTSIYVITLIRDTRTREELVKGKYAKQYSKQHDDGTLIDEARRVVGFTYNLGDATEIVIKNKMDINEGGYYNYVVLERVVVGIYCVPPMEEHWYEWNGGTYKQTHKPERYRKVTNFGIG